VEEEEEEEAIQEAAVRTIETPRDLDRDGVPGRIDPTASTEDSIDRTVQTECC
jgi:hypothetical protein